MRQRAGAGLIPFCHHDDAVWFLFHRTFSGRRAGLLVDFGGGSDAGEKAEQTAVREFIEETEGLFFATDQQRGTINRHSAADQHPRLAGLLADTQRRHPGWRCGRLARDGRSLRDWTTFFVVVEHVEPGWMNQAWADDPGARFAKRRELEWVRADRLLQMLNDAPGRFWRRVLNLTDLPLVVAAIARAYSGKEPNP